jgi:hypothetical protein
MDSHNKIYEEPEDIKNNDDSNFEIMQQKINKLNQEFDKNFSILECLKEKMPHTSPLSFKVQHFSYGTIENFIVFSFIQSIEDYIEC